MVLASISTNWQFTMLLGNWLSELRPAHRSHFEMTAGIWIVPKELSETNRPIRRPLSTEPSELGVMPHVVEKMLGHELGGVLAV